MDFAVKLPPAYYDSKYRYTVSLLKEKPMKFTVKCPTCRKPIGTYLNDTEVNATTTHYVKCLNCKANLEIINTVVVDTTIAPIPQKAYDANDTELNPGDKVVCIKQSEVDPYQIDSLVGKIFTIKEINHDFTSPKITLDCHPLYNYTRGTLYVCTTPNRFVKIIE